MPGIFRGLFNTCTAGEDDQVGEGDFLATGVELLLDTLEFRQHVPQLVGLVGLPELLWGQAQTSAVGTAAFVRTAEGGSRRPRRRDQLRDRQARGQQLAFQGRDVTVVDQWMIDGRNRVLPQQFFIRHFRAEVA
ncbi:hypothetical protein D3C76_820630 [compost metagenome]